jgi:small-conductance mechanosensitive channel
MSISTLYKPSGIVFFVLLFATAPRMVTAQEIQVPSASTQATHISPPVVPSAPVLLDGEVIFEVRGVSAYPAKERAKQISKRIATFAGDMTRSLQSLRMIEEKGFILIFAGQQQLMALGTIDGQFEGGVEPPVLAQVYLRKITEMVKAYREKRESSNLLFNTSLALVATGLLAFTWWGLRWMFTRIDAAIERRFKSQVKDLTIHQVSILQAHQIWSGYHGTLTALRLFLMLWVLYAYLNVVFRLFPWTASLGRQMFAALLDPLQMLGKGLVETIPNLLFIAILVVLFRYLLKFGKLIFANLAEGKVTFKGFEQEWAWPTYRIFRTLMIAFAVVMAYPHFPGSGTNAFKGVTIFLGVLLSLGSMAVIGNILAGYTLVYRRAFRIGDRVRIREHLGDVVERRLLVTHLRSLKNEEIIVPNSEILNSPVINYSSLAKQSGLILHKTVGIGYETPWRQVEAMLVEAADRTPGLLKNPPPFVLHQELGDFCITYELNVYCDRPHDMMQLSTLLSQNILDLFNEHGVQIMTPNYRDDPEQPKVVPKHQWFIPPAKSLDKPQGS